MSVETPIPSEPPPDHCVSEITHRIKLAQDVADLCDDFDYGLARILNTGVNLSDCYGEEKLHALIKLNQGLETLLMLMKPRICDLIKNPRRVKDVVTKRKGEDWCRQWEVSSGEDAIRWICAAMGEEKEMVTERYRRMATALRSSVSVFSLLLRGHVLTKGE